MSTLGVVLVVVLILALIGALPRWGHSSGWGYRPTGVLGAALVVIVVLALMGPRLGSVVEPGGLVWVAVAWRG